jgi:hypothetical protein
MEQVFVAGGHSFIKGKESGWGIPFIGCSHSAMIGGEPNVESVFMPEFLTNELADVPFTATFPGISVASIPQV